jgi:hypothetical protein
MMKNLMGMWKLIGKEEWMMVIAAVEQASPPYSSPKERSD